jgi:hypothetical protein
MLVRRVAPMLPDRAPRTSSATPSLVETHGIELAPARFESSAGECMSRRSAAASPAPDWTAAIAERAYYKAERRGFAPGFELDDWLAAEREVAQSLGPSAAPKRKRKPSVRATTEAAKKSK